MTLVENKYKIRKVQGTWNACTPEEEKIIVLEAYIRKVKSGASRTKMDKKKPPKEKESKKGKQEPDPWMTVPPKTDKPHEKKRIGLQITQIGPFIRTAKALAVNLQKQPSAKQDWQEQSR